MDAAASNQLDVKEMFGDMNLLELQELGKKYGHFMEAGTCSVSTCFAGEVKLMVTKEGEPTIRGPCVCRRRTRRVLEGP